MKQRCSAMIPAIMASCMVLAGIRPSAGASLYPAMAPVSEYLIPDRTAEIALARSAAPPSVSAKAKVLVLGPKGYVTAEPGANGFVCLVQRAWFSGLQDDGFWNPKLRGPICFNPEAARSVLPTFLTRTNLAMAGVSQEEILKRTQAAVAAGKVLAPEMGSLTFMLSKDGYLGDDPRGPWHPHLMFYMPPMRTSDWGAGLPGTQVFGAEAGVDPWTMFFVPMATWSDGTPDKTAGAQHHM